MAKERKVVIITGAANGIGKSIAHRLAESGWQVVGADREEFQPSHENILPRVLDLTAEFAIKELVADTQMRFDRLDAIVSNAGISEFKSLGDSTLADWNRVLATNLTPAFLLAKEGEEALRRARGAMVLISSTRAHMSEQDTHAYSASKGGLVALTHSLAISLGPDVRVNCISPGWISVDGKELSDEDHAQHPVGRVGKPADISAAVEYLLHPNAAFITGSELIIDGGMTRKMIYW